MSLLTRLFGSNKSAEAPLATPPCPHTAMAPKWDAAEDIGDEAKATSWICDACQQTFTPEQAAELRATEADRLRAEAARIDAARRS